MRTIILLPFLFLAGTWPLAAHLKWSETAIELHPKTEDQDAIARYHFKNTGSSPVVIQSVTTSCPCTTAHAEPTVIPPGGKGVIVADFSVPAIMGLQKKQIFVTTDAKENPKTTLDLSIHLPELVKIDPPQLTWTLNGPRTPKTLTVEVQGQQAVNLVQVLWAPQEFHFDADFRVLEPHQKYLVTVTPRATDSAADEHLRLALDYPAYQPKSAWVFVKIVDPKAAPSPVGTAP